MCYIDTRHWLNDVLKGKEKMLIHGICHAYVDPSNIA